MTNYTINCAGKWKNWRKSWLFLLSPGTKLVFLVSDLYSLSLWHPTYQALPISRVVPNDPIDGCTYSQPKQTPRTYVNSDWQKWSIWAEVLADILRVSPNLAICDGYSNDYKLFSNPVTTARASIRLVDFQTCRSAMGITDGNIKYNQFIFIQLNRRATASRNTQAGCFSIVYTHDYLLSPFFVL